MSKSPKISSFSIIVAFICVALVGLAFLPMLPVKLSPSRNLPKLTVSYTMPGNPARVIEAEITSSLEAMLACISGIREIRSKSANGSGSVTLEFDKHTNIDAARFEASTIVRQLWPELPEGVSYPVIEMSRPDKKDSYPFISYTLNAPASFIYIQQYAEEHIKSRLTGLAGIYKIDVRGATPMEWQLVYDSRQLDLLDITLQDIIQAIQTYYTQEFLGLVTTGHKEPGEKQEWIRLVLLPGEKSDLFDPSQITVTNKADKLIRLDQLLKVSRQEETPQSYYRINGLNSIYISIRAEETANQLQVASHIRQEIEEIWQNLPPGYELHVGYDATWYIREELEKIYFRSALTVIILLLFVLLITRSLRYLLLILISLLINLATAIILYYLLKLEMQLYSLAGITISLSLIIDNTIVMIEHMRIRQNRNAFLPVLTATLTTAGALMIIFFLDEKLRINLQDFAAVVIINLLVSLLIALFLVPALIEKIGLYSRKTKKRKVKRSFSKRIAVYFTRFYEKQIVFLSNWKKTACLLLILLFGLPVFMLPDKIEVEDKQLPPAAHYLVNKYNQLHKNETYKEKIKPVIEKGLGALRLFIQKVYEGSYFSNNEEVVLMVSASLPNGSTITQMNNLIEKMEAFPTGFGEIRQFHTEIYNVRQALISVYFTKESRKSGFPYILKSRIISKVLELGGGSWSVFGLQDQGFSNDVRENAGSFRVEMYGYNYDELYAWAEMFKERLLSYRRIQDVIINSEFSWWKTDYQEYYFDLNKRRMAEENIVVADLFSSINQIFGNNITVGQTGTEKLKLHSRQSGEFDIWNMQYTRWRN